VALSALLGQGELGLRLVVAPAGGDPAVLGVHASEMEDPYPYLLGGELLLSAGVHFEEAVGAGAHLDRYVSRIVEAGGAALGFGVAPVHDTVPRALVAACDRYGLPLLEVPPRTPFSAVARAVWRLMAEARNAELRRVAEAQRELAAAASRPDPVPAVLRQLATRLGGRTCLLGRDGALLESAGGDPAPDVRRALARLAGVVRPAADGGSGAPARRRAPSSATDTVGGTRLAAYALAGDGPVLGLVTERREPGDHTIAGVASVLLSLLTARHQDTAEAARSSALVRLLLGEPVAEVAPLLAVPIRDRPSGASAGTGTGTGAGAAAVNGLAAAGPQWVVVHARRTGGGGPGTGTGTASTPGEAATGSGSGDRTAGASGRGWSPGTPQDGTRVGTAAEPGRGPGGGPGRGPGGGPLDASATGAAAQDATAHDVSAHDAAALGAALGSDLVDSGRDVVRVLVDPARGISAQPGWTLGVSPPAGPADLAAADTKAGRALRRAEATRAPLVRHAPGGGFDALVPPEDADAHARALLAPLGPSPALTETLRTWLALHGSWDRTAVALSVHRNTVRQRIARCAALLHCDLDDPDTRMELWFALRRV
ncbi:PucR family transcriptional regulator, partial [Streptomyces sp. GC420]|uniref:PucR family transcriptional regulator n=1 Tax=Streptomyces sp. GC420 TaxID=2697568 RepID=UPI0014152711